MDYRVNNNDKVSINTALIKIDDELKEQSKASQEGLKALSDKIDKGAGSTVTIEAGKTETGLPGTEAKVENVGTDKNAVFDFTIPAGKDGKVGPQGKSATVSVDSTITGEPGTNADVVNVGTSGDAKLKFTIPEGVKGDTGDSGVFIGSYEPGDPVKNVWINPDGFIPPRTDEDISRGYTWGRDLLKIYGCSSDSQGISKLFSILHTKTEAGDFSNLYVGDYIPVGTIGPLQDGSYATNEKFVISGFNCQRISDTPEDTFKNSILWGGFGDFSITDPFKGMESSCVEDAVKNPDAPLQVANKGRAYYYNEGFEPYVPYLSGDLCQAIEYRFNITIPKVDRPGCCYEGRPDLNRLYHSMKKKVSGRKYFVPGDLEWEEYYVSKQRVFLPTTLEIFGNFWRGNSYDYTYENDGLGYSFFNSLGLRKIEIFNRSKFFLSNYNFFIGDITKIFMRYWEPKKEDKKVIVDYFVYFLSVEKGRVKSYYYCSEFNPPEPPKTFNTVFFFCTI